MMKTKLTKILEAHKIDMKWKGNLINIHSSLLPKYRGLNAQKQALAAGDTITGCSIHFVDENVDTGAVIIQEYVPIYKDDTEQTISDRIHQIEHTAYPRALRLLTSGRVQLTNEVICGINLIKVVLFYDL